MIEKPFRPMLATQFEPEKLRFPYYISPKLDGIRCLIHHEGARTRSMKKVPNRYVNDWFQEHLDVLVHLDGEIIVGDPTAPNVYYKTDSAVMTVEGTPDFTFYVFDHIDYAGREPFTDRKTQAQVKIEDIRRKLDGYRLGRVQWIGDSLCRNQHELKTYEELVLDQGFEGAMLRHPDGFYKQGRSTVRENSLLKVKRFVDSEAIITGYEERMHNGNVAEKNELGHTKRSTHQENMVGMGTLGAWIVKGAPDTPFAGIEFSIGGGVGLTDAWRQDFWNRRTSLVGQTVKYSYFDVGIKDKPRHPKFIGFRNDL